MITVFVHNKNVDQSLKWLQRKTQREGLIREGKMRRAYEKPSAKKARKIADSHRRRRKVEKKKSNMMGDNRRGANNRRGSNRISMGR